MIKRTVSVIIQNIKIYHYIERKRIISNKHIEEFNRLNKDGDVDCSLDGYFKHSNSEDNGRQMISEQQNSRNLDAKEFDSGEAGTKQNIKEFHTISSRNHSKLDDQSATDSFIPFSQRTSLTHVPAIYEELIQKYESDIRNHIRIEQQMKLHSDSVLNKLEDKEKSYDKIIDKFKQQEKVYNEQKEALRMQARIIGEENQVILNI